MLALPARLAGPLPYATRVLRTDKRANLGCGPKSTKELAVRNERPARTNGKLGRKPGRIDERNEEAAKTAGSGCCAGRCFDRVGDGGRCCLRATTRAGAKRPHAKCARRRQRRIDG